MNNPICSCLLICLQPMKNIVIVTSFNEIAINDVLRQLSMVNERFPITVFGMPNWLDMENIEFDYFDRLNFHITKTTYADHFHPQYMTFRDQYRQKYGAEPNIYAQRGYDLIYYFGTILEQFGNGFGQHFDKATHIKGLFNDFDFMGGSENQYWYALPGMDYFENKYVNILRYQKDQTFIKINH